jgi:hypothetical protein
MDDVRDIMRLHHDSIHTERSYCDWIKRFIKDNGITSQNGLNGGEPKSDRQYSPQTIDGIITFFRFDWKSTGFDDRFPCAIGFLFMELSIKLKKPFR